MLLKRILLLVGLLAAVLSDSGAQARFRGILLSKNDSLPMPFASIKLVEKGIHGHYTSTNEKGEFGFELDEKKPVLPLEISTIDCHVILRFKPVYSGVEKIYVQQLSSPLDEVVIEGLSARKVVEKAVAAIPVNYDDSGYVAYSFYRQYQKMNAEYKNLVEAEMAVLFNIVPKANQLTATEAFAIEKLRRTVQVDPFNGYFGDASSGLFLQNPVLHLQESSLHPGGFKKMTFAFDSLQSEHAYIVNYISDVSSDGHGVENYSECGLNGESREYGKLYIDKASFAIVKYERHAVRNRAYDYPLFNNFLVPERKYTVEFLEGHLTVEYRKIGKRWYLKKMLRDYTNEFYRTQVYTKDFVITDVFEWSADDYSRYIRGELMDKFYDEVVIAKVPYTYDFTQWQAERPFVLDQKVEVYRDLGKNKPVEQQFTEEGRKK